MSCPYPTSRDNERDTNLNVGSATRVLKQPISVRGLSGTVDVSSEVETDLVGGRHKLRYRNRLGQRSTFKFASTLPPEDLSYIPHARTDTVTSDGRVWTHVGSTRTGSRRFEEGQAVIICENGALHGSAKVKYVVSADAPFSVPYEQETDINLT